MQDPITVRTQRCEFRLSETGTKTLEPITFSLRSGCAITVDYLTADEAREIASALVAYADAVPEQLPDGVMVW